MGYCRQASRRPNRRRSKSQERYVSGPWCSPTNSTQTPGDRLLILSAVPSFSTLRTALRQSQTRQCDSASVRSRGFQAVTIATRPSPTGTPGLASTKSPRSYPLAGRDSLWAKNPIAKPPMLFGHGISSSNHRSGDSKGSSYRHER
jgi:hypothetical protein